VINDGKVKRYNEICYSEEVVGVKKKKRYIGISENEEKIEKMLNKMCMK
jgi:hypothetical protein